MKFILQPRQLYFVVLAGWVNRQQQELNAAKSKLPKNFHAVSIF
ncbi:MAG TPA: hypothetical protein VMX74_02370 [Pirellulales bacterium]|nr:hypothetical protein [Pirellulales bacterium]